MLEYTIQCVDREKRQILFIQVKGYKLQNGFAAHKDEESKLWVLDDLNSGCKVRGGFQSFVNVKGILLASDIQQEVFERRKSERYALLVRRNRDKKTINCAKEIEERKEKLWEI